MKTLNLILLVSLFVLYSCNSGVNTKAEKVTFGIHKIVSNSELPNSLIDSLKAKNVQLNSNLQESIAGYVIAEDTSVLELDLFPEKFRLMKTYSPVDGDKKYFAIFVCEPSSKLNISHISKTKVSDTNVIINFNLEGARIWADLTKNNIGKSIAFVIDNQVYASPLINGEIRNGLAMINNLESEEKAKEISEALNSGN